MGIVQKVNKRTYMETAAGVADLSQYLSTSYPLHSAAIRPLELHNRDHPYKKATSIDLTYVLDGLFMDDAGTLEHVRTAFHAGETVQILCTRSDAAHWWLADYLLPSLAPQDDPDFYPFSIAPESTGENRYHGPILAFASPPVGIARTGVAAGSKGLLAITDVGTLTALRLRYASGGDNYDGTLSAPSEGLHVVDLQDGSNDIPSGAGSGTFTLTPTPSNATYQAVIGYGVEF